MHCGYHSTFRTALQIKRAKESPLTHLQSFSVESPFLRSARLRIILCGGRLVLGTEPALASVEGEGDANERSGPLAGLLTLQQRVGLQRLVFHSQG